MLITTLGFLLLFTGQSLSDFSHFGIPSLANIHFGSSSSGSRPVHHKNKGQADYDAYLNAYYSNQWQQFYQAQAAYYAYWAYGPYGGYAPYGPHGPPPTAPPTTTPAPDTDTTSTAIPTSTGTPTTSTAIPTSTGDPTTSTAVATQPTTTVSPTTSTAVIPQNTDTTVDAVNPPVRAHTTPIPFRFGASNLISPYRSQPFPTYVHGSEVGSVNIPYNFYYHGVRADPYFQIVGKK